MKLGIMQPYFFPYIGYWQLLNAVDQYVLYDDVNFIKGGWINRNRILVNGEIKYFNVPMIGASSFKHINEVGVNNDKAVIDKNIRCIENAYKKAPFYKDVFPVVEDILYSRKENLASYNEYMVKKICEYLDINTRILLSSDIEKNCELRGQDKVIDICKRLGASQYYNAIGGQELYSYEDFKKQNIELSFLKTNKIVYEQFGGEFRENLSIIDVMMFNSVDTIKKFLDEFELV